MPLCHHCRNEAEVVQWANREIDEIVHTGYTCDPRGDRSSAKDDGRKEALKEVLDRLGEPYEHDPDTCLECQLEKEILEETEP